jgi:hypothetical protein
MCDNVLMRTTIDIDQPSYELAKAVAAQKGLSLGRIVAEAVCTAYGAAPLDGDNNTSRSEAGFMTIRVGTPITSDRVADLLDD